MRQFRKIQSQIYNVPRLFCASLRNSRFHSTKKKSREFRIAEEDYFAHLSISKVNQEFNFINENVTKVVDLGYAPGNWLQYIQHSLASIHNVDPNRLYIKCTVVGLDLLFCQAPLGTYSIQGNIFSQSAHANIVDLLKKRTYLLSEAQKSRQLSLLSLLPSLTKDETSSLENDISKLANRISTLEMEKKLAYFDVDVALDLYQADLITSDLTAAYLQRGGYFNNTMTKPYIRIREKEVLRQPLVNPHKAHLDLADAALLLCCDALSKNGTLVLRLAAVDLADPELALLTRRLNQMFDNVQEWFPTSVNSRYNANELYLVCTGKKSQKVDKYDLFDVQRINLVQELNSVQQSFSKSDS